MSEPKTGTGGLSAEELEVYERDGLVVPRFRVPPEKLVRLQAALEAVLGANPDVRAERLIGAHIEKKGAEGVQGDRAFFDLARDDSLLDLVESCIGPDIILWSTHLLCKPAGDGKEVPWHQDGHYWPIRPLTTCSVWVALDDVTLENGAMGFIPASHSQKQPFTHSTTTNKALALNQVLDEDQVDLETAKYNVLEPGQMSLHDVHLVHGSPANRSTKRRAAFILRYMPSTSLFDRTIVNKDIVVDFTTMPIYLVRGVDRHGGNDFEVGH